MTETKTKIREVVVNISTPLFSPAAAIM